MSSQFVKLFFPLTTHTGKIRVKKRKDIFYQGLPVATRQTPLDSDCYLEWQISYDLRKDSSNFEKHYESVKNKGEIRDEKGELTGRFVYELSDYLIEIIKQGFIGLGEIKKMLKEIKEEKEFLTDELEIYRSHPKKWTFKQ
ncbi:hypothetical protein C1645_837835 [Glomus cerebriforme]|uniref:Uncharacterized protein n=1 Tax=Glomus cerebriforme TaxID=658196 RepID=A0A397S600_9GLOM|nr:hypothetical protein C1645_837835 [Glomus cerebriforme]